MSGVNGLATYINQLPLNPARSISCFATVDNRSLSKYQSYLNNEKDVDYFTTGGLVHSATFHSSGKHSRI